MATIPHRSNLVRCIGLMAATAMLAAAPRAEAVPLAGSRTAMTSGVPIHTVQFHGHPGGGHGGGHGGGFRGGGFHGGGFHGGGFHGGGFHAAPAPRAFHGGGFHASRPAFVGGLGHGPVFRHGGGGFHRAPVFAGHRAYAPARFYRHHHRHFGPRVYGPLFYGYTSPYYYGYAPDYYYGPRRFCRMIWTHHGLRRVCHYRPWHRHWRHHHWRRHHWHSHRWHHHHHHRGHHHRRH